MKYMKIRTQHLHDKYPSWVPYLSFGLCMVPLYDFRLHVAMRVLLGNKCVYDIENRGGKYENILYFDCCNEK
jgi:hypothetical protein